jgi:uncharacterized protein
MSNPAKVLGFLDLAGKWDPSLAFVTAGAIAVGVAAFAVIKRRSTRYLGLPLSPAATHIDRRLVTGCALFGTGWGLAGIRPGPGLVLVGMGAAKGWLLVAAMLTGMAIFEGLQRLVRSERAAR